IKKIFIFSLSLMLAAADKDKCRYRDSIRANTANDHLARVTPTGIAAPVFSLKLPLCGVLLVAAILGASLASGCNAVVTSRRTLATLTHLVLQLPPVHVAAVQIEDKHTRLERF